MKVFMALVIFCPFALFHDSLSMLDANHSRRALLPAVAWNYDAIQAACLYYAEAIDQARNRQYRLFDQAIHNAIYAYCNELMDKLLFHVNAATIFAVLDGLNNIGEAFIDFDAYVRSGGCLITAPTKLKDITFSERYREFYEGKTTTFTGEPFSPFSPIIRLLKYLVSAVSIHPLAQWSPCTAFLKNVTGSEQLARFLQEFHLFVYQTVPTIMFRLTGERPSHVVGYQAFRRVACQLVRDVLGNNCSVVYPAFTEG